MFPRCAARGAGHHPEQAAAEVPAALPPGVPSLEEDGGHGRAAAGRQARHGSGV